MAPTVLFLVIVAVSLVAGAPALRLIGDAFEYRLDRYLRELHGGRA
ncbi:MAG: hypothetical protein ACRDQW_10005 [Haloechinothrix sp.]